ncbi:MAG: DinB family protein [Anaerolineales bacterium]
MPGRKELLFKRLTEESEKTLVFFRALNDAQLAQPVYASGPGWDARGVLAHMLWTERAFNYYNREVLNGGPGAPEDFNIDGFNAEQTPLHAHIALPDLLKQFEAERAETLRLVEHSTDPDFDRQAFHPFLGRTTLEEILKLLYRHTMLHARDVRKALDTGQPLPVASDG